MYNCSASRPSIKSQTKESTIEPVTETLSLTADPREDGLVKGRTGDTTDQETYDGWYESVYVPLDTLSLEHTTLPTGIDLTGGGQNDA